MCSARPLSPMAEGKRIHRHQSPPLSRRAHAPRQSLPGAGAMAQMALLPHKLPDPPQASAVPFEPGFRHPSKRGSHGPAPPRRARQARAELNPREETPLASRWRCPCRAAPRTAWTLPSRVSGREGARAGCRPPCPSMSTQDVPLK